MATFTAVQYDYTTAAEGKKFAARSVVTFTQPVSTWAARLFRVVVLTRGS